MGCSAFLGHSGAKSRRKEDHQGGQRCNPGRWGGVARVGAGAWGRPFFSGSEGNEVMLGSRGLSRRTHPCLLQAWLPSPWPTCSTSGPSASLP